MTLLLAILVGCTEPVVIEPTEIPRPDTFQLAELTPEFEHANAVWAGVALLDYDNDGWQDLHVVQINTPNLLYRNPRQPAALQVQHANGDEHGDGHGERPDWC